MRTMRDWMLALALLGVAAAARADQVSGVVQDEKGQPVPGVAVALEVGHARYALTASFDHWYAVQSHSGKSGDDGRFTFDDLPEGAVATVHVNTGEAVIGFRSPGFCITDENRWVFDVVVEAGYRYDASVFPAPHGHGGLCACNPQPHVIATANGPLPTAWSSLEEKVPSPHPGNVDTVLLPKFATARSSTPLPLKSPTATERGALPVGYTASSNSPFPFPRNTETWSLL